MTYIVPMHVKPKFTYLLTLNSPLISDITSQSICFYFVSHQSDQQILTWSYPKRAISKFGLEKFKVKIMGEAKGQCDIIDPVFDWCTSFLFHVNRINHSWDMANRVFPDLYYVPNIQDESHAVFPWEVKVVAAAAETAETAETNWKHKVTAYMGDSMTA